MTALLLETFGHRVVVAADGSDGLKQAFACRPDVIITDLMMPIMDGVALCRAVRLDPRLQRTAIVLMSAAWTALQEAPCDFSARLGKPFDVDGLLAAVDDALRLRTRA